MKPPCLVLILVPILSLSMPPRLAAAETVKLETVLYLFKSKSIPKIDFSQALRGTTPLSGEGIVITPPATILFDNEELVLGADYAWNGGQVVPARFSETKLPVIVTALGQAATIRVVAPVQYLEKMPDGSLKVREVAGNLPDVPHYLLTVTARPAVGAPPGYDLIVTCQMDIATLQGREKLPGIDLEAGRPITARFDKRTEFWSRKGEWFGIMAGQEESGDYALFLLLKISSDSASPAPVAGSVPGPKVVPVDPGRIELSGYTVAAPSGSHWRRKKSDRGVVFENRVYFDAYFRAGFLELSAPALADRKSFLDFVKQAVQAGSDTSRYMSVKDDFVEKERDGLWLVECSLKRNDWAFIEHDPPVTRIQALYASDAGKPGRVMVAWYSWHGITYNEAKFAADAAAFLGSLRKASP